MTAAEKNDLARFLDIAQDAVRGGFSYEEGNYNFTDDSQVWYLSDYKKITMPPAVL